MLCIIARNSVLCDRCHSLRCVSLIALYASIVITAEFSLLIDKGVTPISCIALPNFCGVIFTSSCSLVTVSLSVFLSSSSFNFSAFIASSSALSASSSVLGVSTSITMSVLVTGSSTTGLTSSLAFLLRLREVFGSTVGVGVSVTSLVVVLVLSLSVVTTVVTSSTVPLLVLFSSWFILLLFSQLVLLCMKEKESNLYFGTKEKRVT